MGIFSIKTDLANKKPQDFLPRIAFEKFRELVWPYLAVIDELDDPLEVREGHVPEDNDGMLPGGDVPQDLPEVGGAGGQDDLVGLEGLALGAEGDVDKVLVGQQLLEGAGHAVLVVVPLQAVRLPLLLLLLLLLLKLLLLQLLQVRMVADEVVLHLQMLQLQLEMPVQLVVLVVAVGGRGCGRRCGHPDDVHGAGHDPLGAAQHQGRRGRNSGARLRLLLLLDLLGLGQGRGWRRR